MTKKMEKFVANNLLEEWKKIASLIIAQSQPRNRQLEFSSLGALALIGVRRCGKTSIAILKAQEISADNFLYMNFEDPRFIEFNTFHVFDILLETYIETYKQYPEVIVFDELQNIEGWERWVRKFVDSKKSKLIITGSSAKLLSSELSTAVAGRVLEYKIWPLSFPEYLSFKNQSAQSKEDLALFAEYMQYGAFPEVVMTKSLELKKKILSQYFTDILFKDVMARKGLRDKKTLEKIVYHYLTNISCHHSYSALKRAYELGGNTPQNYTEFLQDAFLIFEVERFHKNLKVQIRDTKKIYSIDTGLRNFNSKNLTEDLGKILENIIFLHLKHLDHKIYYFKEQLETDFVIVEGIRPTAAIQVTDSNLEDKKLYDREVNGLLECLNYTGLEQGLVLTKNRRETLSIKKKTIQMIPTIEWLTSSHSRLEAI